MRWLQKSGGLNKLAWLLLLLMQIVAVRGDAFAIEQTFTRTGKYKYSESESRTSMKLHVKEIIIQEVLQTDVGGYSQSMLNLEKQESTAGGGVRSSSTQSITQISVGVIKSYFVVKDWTDDVYFYTTAEVTVDMDATKRKLDEIAAERKKDDDAKSEITKQKQEALEQKNAALEAQNKLLQQQADINAQVKTLAEAQAKLERDRVAAQQSIDAQNELLRQQAELNAQTKALAERQAKLNQERAAMPNAGAMMVPVGAAPAPQAGAPANFAYIRGGVFTMGSPADEVDHQPDEGPPHQVRLSDFYMGKYEVTVGEFRKYIEESGELTEAEKAKEATTWRHGVNGQLRPASEENHPVMRVTWNDAVAYSKWLSLKTGRGFRLPTEAEWEYACRGGSQTSTPFNTGYNLPTSQANYDGNYPYNNNQKGIYRGNTVAVNSFAPNGWGLYNMHGNVWEWCSDWYGAYSATSATNPAGTVTGSYRVLRGGSWNSYAERCRSAYRFHLTPAYRRNFIGFRLVFVP